MIEIVHDDGRCIERTPDAVIIAERIAAGYNPVARANQIPRSITSGDCNVNQGASPAVADVAPCHEGHYYFKVNLKTQFTTSLKRRTKTDNKDNNPAIFIIRATIQPALLY